MVLFCIDRLWLCPNCSLSCAYTWILFELALQWYSEHGNSTLPSGVQKWYSHPCAICTFRRWFWLLWPFPARSSDKARYPNKLVSMYRLYTLYQSGFLSGEMIRHNLCFGELWKGGSNCRTSLMCMYCRRWLTCISRFWILRSWTHPCEYKSQVFDWVELAVHSIHILVCRTDNIYS